MFQDTVTLVTGGASGLGKAVVEKIIDLGGKVVVCDLPTSKGATVAKTLGKNCLFCAADVVSETDIRDVMDTIKNNFGCLNFLVNCAGILDANLFIYDFKKDVPQDLHKIKRLLEVNVLGTINVIRLAVGLIAKNAPKKDGLKGVIINTSSVSSTEGYPGVSPYSASKAAICGLSLPLAREFAPQGIRVCSICPGLFKTPMTETVPEKFLDDIVKLQIPFPKRLGNPEEFAHLVQCIIENPLLNGTDIRLDAATRLNF